MFLRTADDEYRTLFGQKTYKVSLRLREGTTCPNRDGVKGKGGCAFCTGSGEYAEPPAPLGIQLEKAIGRIRSKLPEGGDPCRFIAYYQDHTNTYAPFAVLRESFTAAVCHPLVCGLSVGTRPDCLPENVLSLLGALAKEKPVWVELGLQTANEETAAAFGRGYPNAVYEESAFRLRRAGIRVVTHLILGLPGETTETMTDTVRYVNGKTDGVKFHMLHVLRNTPYAERYKEGLLSAYALPEYIEDLSACVRALSPDVFIHRLTGDGPKKDLIAPLWSGDKKHVLNAVHRAFREADLVQGSDLREQPAQNGGAKEGNLGASPS